LLYLYYNKQTHRTLIDFLLGDLFVFDLVFGRRRRSLSTLCDLRLSFCFGFTTALLSLSVRSRNFCIHVVALSASRCSSWQHNIIIISSSSPGVFINSIISILMYPGLMQDCSQLTPVPRPFVARFVTTQGLGLIMQLFYMLSANDLIFNTTQHGHYTVITLSSLLLRQRSRYVFARVCLSVC